MGAFALRDNYLIVTFQLEELKEEPMTDNTIVSFLLDETGSMDSVRDTTVSGFKDKLHFFDLESFLNHILRITSEYFSGSTSFRIFNNHETQV